MLRKSASQMHPMTTQCTTLTILPSLVNYIKQHVAVLVTALPKIEQYANDSSTGKTLTEDQKCHTLETMKGMKHPKDP